MFKEKLLIGQYYAVASPVHRLDARCKIIVTLIYMITLFIANNWLAWATLAIVFLLALFLSRVPLKSLWRGLKVMAIFCIITVVINIFVYPGEHILWSWRVLSISTEGISHGLAMGLRLLLLVAFASLLTLTTTPLALTDGLEDLMRPLERIHVPAHEIAMMTSIALRFVPTILEEFDHIVLAQKARGAKIGEGKLIQRLMSFIPLMVPLFVAAFRRADDLAQAMEAKCYRGGKGRTRWKVSVWHRYDTLVLAFFILLMAAAIVCRSIV